MWNVRIVESFAWCLKTGSIKRFHCGWGKLHSSPSPAKTRAMFEEAQLRYLYRNISFCNVSVTGGKILARFGDVLFNYVLLKPTFKSSIRMAKSQRSLVARLRAGILPLAPDVGRFKHFQEDNKLCELYELMESHFPLYWSYHDDETSFQHP